MTDTETEPVDRGPISIPDIFGDVDTPGAQPGEVPFSDLTFQGMSRLDDAALEVVVTAMRDAAQAQYRAFARWVRVIRARRTLTLKSERAAAKEAGVSRTTIRNAKTRK